MSPIANTRVSLAPPSLSATFSLSPSHLPYLTPTLPLGHPLIFSLTPTLTHALCYKGNVICDTNASLLPYDNGTQ